MPTRKRSLVASNAVKLGELSLAVPQVVAHRLTRMALAGPTLSARDQKEFTQMIQEKQQAFAHSWMNMFAEAWRIQQSMLSAWFSSFSGMPFMFGASPARQRRQARQLHSHLNKIASKGLAPIHQKAVANSRRLAKTSLR